MSDIPLSAPATTDATISNLVPAVDGTPDDDGGTHSDDPYADIA